MVKAFMVDNKALTIDKVDDDGIKCGDRPIMVGQEPRRFFLGCITDQCKDWAHNHFTHALPEGITVHEKAVTLAEMHQLEASMAYQAAHQSSLTEDSAAPYLTKLKQADIELQQARIPPKFVTNFCFSQNGCAHVFRIVEWWHNLWPPTNHTIADDITNMGEDVRLMRWVAPTSNRRKQPKAAVVEAAHVPGISVAGVCTLEREAGDALVVGAALVVVDHQG